MPSIDTSNMSDYERQQQEEIQKLLDNMDDSTARPAGRNAGEEWNWH